MELKLKNLLNVFKYEKINKFYNINNLKVDNEFINKLRKEHYNDLSKNLKG